jgi:DNA-binding response OmpR family regulator
MVSGPSTTLEPATTAGAASRRNTAANGQDALKAAREERPDVVVLDLMLPGADGWHVIRQAREWAPRLPIIVVTARTNEHDRVEVLAHGADDVMGKPFSMRELLARITAALRRTAVENARSERLPVQEGELSIDPARMSVIVAGRPADLTPLEFKLLLTLVEERERALSRDEIFRRVWGAERAHGDRSVDVLVRRLRRKVDEVGGAYTYIQTLHGVGYRFLTTPRRLPVAVPAALPGPAPDPAGLLRPSRGAPVPPAAPRAS